MHARGYYMIYVGGFGATQRAIIRFLVNLLNPENFAIWIYLPGVGILYIFCGFYVFYI